MAEFASRRETGVRYRGRSAVVIRLVAGNARRDRNVVIVVLVAARTRGRSRRHMLADQREARGRMVKLPIRPRYRVVAAFARCRETRVIDRCFGSVIVRLMARNARG